MAAGRVLGAAAGGSPDATRSGGYEASGEKVAEQLPGVAIAQRRQHHTRQLQGIASRVHRISMNA